MEFHVCGNAPCYYCEEREPPDCHARCEKYKEWSEKKNLALSHAKRNKNATGFMVSNKMDRANRMQRGMGGTSVRIRDVWGR